MKYFAALLLLSFSLFGHAQKRLEVASLDSLKAAIGRHGDDSEKVKLLDRISFVYSSVNPEEGLHYAREALALAQRISWSKGESASLNDLGNNYLRMADYPQALRCFLNALRINEELKDERGIGMVAGNIGTVYYSQKNYSRALNHFFLSLKKAKLSGDREGEQLATGNIGTVYYAEGKYQEALAHMERACAIAEALGNKKGMAEQMSNIGNVYSSLGNNKEALDWYSKALSVAKEVGETQLVAANEGNIGEAYLDMAKDSTLGLGDKTKYVKLGIDYLQNGIASARAIAYNQALIDFLQNLSGAYELQGDQSAALKTFKQYTALKDSIFSIDNNERIVRLETQRALELKDKDIQIANLAVARKRDERWFFIAGIALLLTILIVLFRSFRHQQHSNELLSREKQRSDTLLHNILPEEVAEELKETGGAHAKQFDHVSVLFTDFVNFTGTAETLSPQVLVRELHECFSAFDGIIEKNGLEKIKTVGDAYVAACGLPVENAEHAQKCVKAALEILEFMEARRRHERAFEIRIGINSGPVVAGIVGVKKFAYDIWGDTVNTAARLEQSGAPGRINISQSTYELVRDKYACEYRGKIAAKNKGEVEMYFIGAPVKKNGVASLDTTPMTLQ
jgi:class 3 adenylate cyclase/Tfp pilus assembly protein PilF